MPSYDFVCKDCSFKKEHYVATADAKKNCPKCGSAAYNKKLPKVKVDVAFSSSEDFEERGIQPFREETLKKIGRETLNGDTKTLEDLYGTDRVKDTFYESND
jgi:putative FmdB family regulatory protein